MGKTVKTALNKLLCRVLIIVTVCFPFAVYPVDVFHGNGKLGHSLSTVGRPAVLPYDFDNFDVDGFSFGFWFLSKDIPRHQMLFDTRALSGVHEGIYAYIEGGTGKVVLAAKGTIGPTKKIRSQSRDYDNDIWHYVRVNYDGVVKELSLNVNGVDEGYVSLSGIGEIDNEDENTLGHSVTGAKYFKDFEGRFDEVKYWSTSASLSHIKSDIRNVLQKRLTPIKTKSVRLAAYLRKGPLDLYLDYYVNTLDLLIGKFGNLYSLYQSTDRSVAREIRRRKPDFKIWLMDSPTILSELYNDFFPNSTTEVSDARLKRPDSTYAELNDQDASHLFNGDELHVYDVQNQSLINGFSEYIKNSVFNDISHHQQVDAIVADALPIGWARFFSSPDNIGMHSVNTGFVYNGSFERKLQAVERFINGVNSNGVKIVPNVHGHESSSSSPARLLSTELSGVWFEVWINNYLDNSLILGKTPRERERDIVFAEESSRKGMDTVLSISFDYGDDSSFESMIAYYLIAKESDSLKLHPMPVHYIPGSTFSGNGSRWGDDNDRWTQGFSAQLLFERLQKYRSVLELDVGSAFGSRQNIGGDVYRKEFARAIVLVNNTGSQISIPSSIIRKGYTGALRYLRGGGALGSSVVVPPAGGRVLLK